MKQNILLSIIVPIYRVEKYLQECVDSLVNQTIKEIEIILVDDGSDDECPQICDKYAERDSRIKVVHKKNGGQDSARKAGIAIATGKYVGYVDGDDWVEPFMYERMLSDAERYQVAAVETGIIDSWNYKESKRHSYLPEGCYKSKEFRTLIEPYILYSGSFFQHGISPYLCTKIFLRDEIIKYQNIDDILNRTQDDIMVSIPCIVATQSVYISHKCYYHYRVRTNSEKRVVRQDDVKHFIECYPLMYNRFKGSSLSSNNDNQVKIFSMYWLLMRAPYVFAGNADVFFAPIRKLKLHSKIVLYGAGAVGIHWNDFFCKEGVDVICWADKNFETLSVAYNVCNPTCIANLEYDYVVIAILRETAVESAKKDLIQLGVSEEKICWIDEQYIHNPTLLLQKARYGGKKLF